MQGEDLKSCRQWESKTPGHPENFATPSLPQYESDFQSVCGYRWGGGWVWGCSNYFVFVVESGSGGASQVKLGIVVVEILAGDVV